MVEHYWIAWQMEKIKHAEFLKKAERTRRILQLRKGRHRKITKAIFVMLGTLAALVLGVLAVIYIPSPRFKL